MISIIIPTFNEEEYLPKLLSCIKKQAYKDYEIIVADADSSDKTRQIAKRHGCKIVNGGMPAVGRNNGAKSAKWDVLLFLDADLQFDSNFLKNAIGEFEEQKLDAAGCYIRPLSNNIIDKILFGIFNLWIFATQFFYPNASGSGIFCKKWLHKKINGFDETIRLSEDMDYVKRCGKHGKFRIIKSAKSYVAMRRFENEGRLKVGLKLLLSALYRIFFGEIRSDIFKYNLRYRRRK
ncbi:glycosyltransferase [Candidatus Woesearchaeota archaeon]|nr:glycosyltransferase [Candidatus Woesearchaeota archaeon]